jgi:hypothetical protein
VRGLADGDPEYDATKDDDPAIASKTDAEKQAINAAAHKKNLRGVLYISSLGKRLPNETNDEPRLAALKQTLRRKKFWGAMANYVEHWGQERYVAFEAACSASTLASQSSAIATMEEQLPNMANTVPRYKAGAHKGESPVGTALYYLAHRYSPVINTAWTEDKLSLVDMRRFTNAQVYAVRDFADTHRYPDGRIGIYYRSNPAKTKADNDAFQDRIAASLNAAYDGAQGDPIAACGPSGGTACLCAR